MGNSIRGTHSSPGIYTKFTDLTYAAKSLGITTLGLVGETVKGPAFEPITVSNFTEFVEMFGSTSPEVFKDSLYPRYELPYIAESYLKKSDQLSVCRVLGLSGYNAGPAFVITAGEVNGSDKYVVAVLRSRGEYRKYANIGTDCNPVSKYDTLLFDCDEVSLEPYMNWEMKRSGCDVEASKGTGVTSIDISTDNYGQFTVVCKKNGSVVGSYPVSLNAGAKDYIYSVLGKDPVNGTAAVFVEELYDLRLMELVAENKAQIIHTEVKKIDEVELNPVMDPVTDFVTVPYSSLKKSMAGKYYLCDVAGVMEESGSTAEPNGYVYMKVNASASTSAVTVYEEAEMEVGHIYVVSYLKTEDGMRVLRYFDSGKMVSAIYSSGTKVDTVKVLSTNEFYMMSTREVEMSDTTINSIPCITTVKAMSDYHEQFRSAMTPWFVSEIKGDGNKAEVKKLFRFYTITDGAYANEQVKVTIANVRPDEGRFDVLIRDYNDSDGNMTILESYRNLTMVPGDSKYIGLQIGTIDGAYEINSKYVMVEVIENDMTEYCVPCGFLGYPVRDYEAVDSHLVAPTFVYNKNFDDTIKAGRQCFGLSDITGVDNDMLLYKGKSAYVNDYRYGYTRPFHLDSTLNPDVVAQLGVKITIDGDETTQNIVWEAVSLNQGTAYSKAPVIGSEVSMEGSLYEDKATRKFTVCFYGGFDGWDIYRRSRTTGDEFKANKYKGTITNGYGVTFSRVSDGTALGLKGNCITSDYYAFLAGARQYADAEKQVINLFATPGIDYVNNQKLVEEVLETIENRQDTLYVVTTPDKPYGASDEASDMYSSADAVNNLTDAGIDTYYAATYYPWVKYFDSRNNKFINLPATKDVLRNMADVDNKSYPWMAPAGIERGAVECKRLHKFATIDDEDTLYDGMINPLKTFSKDGIKVWGNKTMYSTNSPMNRVNVVRMMLYMRKLIIESSRTLIFDQNDTTLASEFDKTLRGILTQIKKDRGITDFKLVVSQTAEEMDAHELNATLYVKPTPTLEYISINFVVTPQGVDFESL